MYDAWRSRPLPEFIVASSAINGRKRGVSLKTNLNGKATRNGKTTRNVHDEEDYVIPRPGILLILITVAVLAHVEVFVFWFVSPHTPTSAPTWLRRLLPTGPNLAVMQVSSKFRKLLEVPVR